MAVGQVIYGVDGRRDYAFAPLDEPLLFRLGADAERLLPVVLQSGGNRLTADDLPDLPLCDYELILAHVYCATFGEIVGQNVDCSACAKKFSVEISLPAWVRQVRDTVAHDCAATFDGESHALPTRAILNGMPNRTADALADRLWRGTAPLPAQRRSAFEKHIGRACPVLQDDIEAPCPACGETEYKRFTLRGHLASRLTGQLQTLLRDMHVLASSYHWRPADILALPRRTRRSLVDTIGQQAQRRRALVPG